VIAEGVESFFDVCVQREPRGEAARARGLYELLLIVDDVKGESGANLCGIGEIETFHEREQAVGEEAVRSVPWVRTELLGAELGLSMLKSRTWLVRVRERTYEAATMWPSPKAWRPLI